MQRVRDKNSLFRAPGSHRARTRKHRVYRHPDAWPQPTYYQSLASDDRQLQNPENTPPSTPPSLTPPPNQCSPKSFPEADHINRRVDDRDLHHTSEMAGCWEGHALNRDLRMPRSTKLAKHGIEMENQKTFNELEIIEIVRMREYEDLSFFMIATLLDKDEKAVAQAYYKWLRDDIGAEVEGCVDARVDYSDSEGKCEENDGGGDIADNDGGSNGSDDDLSLMIALQHEMAASSPDSPGTDGECIDQLKGTDGDAAASKIFSARNRYRCLEKNASTPYGTLLAPPNSPEPDNQTLEPSEQASLSIPLDLTKLDEMVRSSRFPAMQKTPKSRSPSSSGSRSHLTRAAKRAASSKASSSSSGSGVKVDRRRPCKRLKRARDASNASPSLSESSGAQSVSSAAMEVDSQTVTPPLLPKDSKDVTNDVESASPSQNPDEIIMLPSDSDDDEQPSVPNTNNSPKNENTTADSAATNAARDSVEEKIFVPDTAKVEELDRLFFGPRPQRVLSMEEMSRFIDPMKLTRFNPALKKPAKK
ncbi:hypothetical protein ABW21_db0204664 [Orbilia brochopaga]|nr:hypothetical protein ABW21_db0204664 [Drechslerella brochopaga]